MDEYIQKIGWTLIYPLLFIFILSSFLSILKKEEFFMNHVNFNPRINETTPIINEDLFIVSGAIIKKDHSFDYRNYAFAYTSDYDDLSSYISVEGNIDTSIIGEYELTYTLHYKGYKVSKKAKYYVSEEIIEPVYHIHYLTYYHLNNILIKAETDDLCPTYVYESNILLGKANHPDLLFEGWYDNPNFEGDKITETKEKDLILFAKFIPV